MSLQDLLKKILDDAAAEVAVIEKETEKKKKDIDEEFTAKEKEELTELNEKTEVALAAVEEKIKSMARRENAKTLLGAKQKIIEKALSEFLKKLEGADEETYGKVLDRLFAQIQPQGGEVLVPQNRTEITRKHAPEGIKITSDENINGGFIFHSGGSQIDNSFHNLVLSEYRSEFTTYFAEQLKLV